MRGRSLTSVLVVAVACAGCATEAPGQPTPIPTTSESRVGEAPPINSPELDLASFEDRVCDLVLLDQLAPFGLNDPGEVRDDAVGPSCTWKPPDPTEGVRVNLVILSKVGYGWEGLYQRKARWNYFESAGEINGYPAVHLDSGDAANGRCTTTVGARMDLIFDVLVQVSRTSSPDYRTPCAVTDRVASLVIDTLKKGGR